MILFQHVKNLVVCGTLLRGPILEALMGERKIPSSVADALKGLNEAISSGQSDNELTTLVKECGLARDIGKCDKTALESYLAER